MAESLPRDPFSGVVVYARGHDRCPPQVKARMVAQIAGVTGLECLVLPNETKEDGQVIDAISGVSSPQQYRAPDTVPDILKTSATITEDDQARPVVAVVRLAGPERQDFEALSARLSLLLDAVNDITGRLN